MFSNAQELHQKCIAKVPTLLHCLKKV